MCLLVAAIGNFADGSVYRSSELRIHMVIVERNRIIARHCLFTFVREPRHVSMLVVHGRFVERSRNGHKLQVLHGMATHTAIMCQPKAVYLVPEIFVTRTRCGIFVIVERVVRT